MPSTWTISGAGLLVPHGIWSSQTYLTPDAALLVLCSHQHDPADYEPHPGARPPATSGNEMTPPELTICIPAYQAEAFIDRTLWCARRQTYPGIRIAVSIDQSSDATEEICRAHAVDDSRVTVLAHQDRLGWAANTNALLDLVQTDFFFLYFHDDVIAPEYAEVLLAALRERPEAVSAHGDMDRFGEQAGVLQATTFDGDDTRRLVTYLLAPASGPMLRGLTRSRVLERGLRFPFIGRPGVWQVEPYKLALVAAGPVLGVPRLLYHRWHRPGSLTADWTSGPLEPVLEGQRLQCALALEILDGAAVGAAEKEVLRFCLYLQAMRYVRRHELRLPPAPPAAPEDLCPVFTGVAPAGALAGLEPGLASAVARAHAQVLFLEGRMAVKRREPAIATERLAAAVRLDPAHRRAATLLVALQAGAPGTSGGA